MNVSRYFYLFLYYVLFRKLPRSSFPIVGETCKKLRVLCCKNIFSYCGENVNVERNAYFGKGFELKIGDYSGLGRNCSVPSNIQIGRYVMMGPDVFILHSNHEFSDLSRPMCMQGSKVCEAVVIEDDVWIGRQVMVNPGRVIKKGSIVAAATALVKDFPEFSIIGGNPSRVIGSRLGSEQ